MQILIATQGVTPNSVEINTNCVLPGNCSLSDLPSTDVSISPHRREAVLLRYILLSPSSPCFLFRTVSCLFSIANPSPIPSFSPIVQTFVRDIVDHDWPMIENSRLVEKLGITELGGRSIRMVDSKDRKFSQVCTPLKSRLLWIIPSLNN